MGFDIKGFLSAQFEPRRGAVRIRSSGLIPFFDDPKNPKWFVRSLTGYEVGRSDAAVERNRNVAKIIEGLISASRQDGAALNIS